MTLNEFLSKIAVAIRSRTGTTMPINATDFETEISHLPPMTVVSDFVNGTLTQIAIPYGTPTLRKYGFYNFKDLKSLIIPETVTTIEDHAISGKSRLGSLVLPDSVTTIQDYALAGIDKVGEIDIPESVTSYGQNIFNMTYAEKIKIPKNILSKLTYNSKKWCGEVRKYHVNPKLVYKGTLQDYFAAFAERTDATYTVFDAGSYIFDAYFYDEDGNEIQVTNFDFNGFYDLPAYLFARVFSIKNVTIPDTVMTIGAYCLYGTNIRDVVIPKNVTSIGNYALHTFNSDKKLTVIMETETPPTISSKTFNTSNLDKIFVPVGTKDTYKAASVWSTFASYIYEPNEAVTLQVADTVLNNENCLYSIDQGKTWQQFTANTISLEYITTLRFKSLTADTVITIGSTEGGAEIGTIANAELSYTADENETIYIGA